MAIRDKLQQLLYRIISPVVRLCIKLRITPNMITGAGLILNIVVAVIFIIGAEKNGREDLSYVGWGGFMILVAGIFDMIDGQVARLGKMTSIFGALFDSVLDRYSELVMFLGICYYLVSHHYFFSSLIAFIALIGSIMVSYTRARAESLGIPCKDGLMQRPERIVLIGTAALACGIIANYTGGNQKWPVPGFSSLTFESISVFTIPLTVVAILSNVTAFHRLRACYLYLGKNNG